MSAEPASAVPRRAVLAVGRHRAGQFRLFEIRGEGRAAAASSGEDGVESLVRCDVACGTVMYDQLRALAACCGSATALRGRQHLRGDRPRRRAVVPVPGQAPDRRGRAGRADVAGERARGAAPGAAGRGGRRHGRARLLLQSRGRAPHGAGPAARVRSPAAPGDRVLRQPERRRAHDPLVGRRDGDRSRRGRAAGSLRALRARRRASGRCSSSTPRRRSP